MNLRTFVVCMMGLLVAAPAFAYPEFQTFVEAQSSRNVNCALCHAHADGPEGLKPGQIGSLSPLQLEKLNKARGAFEPGQEVESPILNPFGNHIIEALGKQRFLQIRQDPGSLVSALGRGSDLDRDGIPDVDEYLAGTLPTDPNHGDPWTLFRVNLARRWFHILMIFLATGAGLYGLSNFIQGFDRFTAEKAIDS